MDVVRLLKVRPRFLIAKGGITSNDVATKGGCCFFGMGEGGKTDTTKTPTDTQIRHHRAPPAVGLGIKRAMTVGPILPGVPVWECGGESKFPGMKVNGRFFSSCVLSLLFVGGDGGGCVLIEWR